MLGFLAPLWLVGLSSLLVPIALHLWSRRAGRAVRVGSIRLLSGAPPPMARRPRLYDPWLLVLRSVLLTALVLALARPYWAPRRPAAAVWALVATDVADRRALVDSLERSGRTVRPLEPGDIWLNLTIADAAAPSGTRFEVYATPLLRGTRGTRPLLRSPVVWHARASARAPDSVAAPARARIVTVFADPLRGDDARYVVAALRAAGTVSGKPAILATRAAVAFDQASLRSTDWIVWLSDQPLPDAIRQRLDAGATVLTDAGHASQGVTRAAWLDRAPVWTDATGTPLLTVARQGRGLHYDFHSRFTATASDFVLDPAFPEAMARLWIGADSTRTARDDRPIAVSQVVPAYDPQRGAATAGTGARSLFLPLWLLAVGLFLVERRIATRKAVP